MNIQAAIAIAGQGMLLWFAVMYFAARIGGWSNLAKRFPATEPVSGDIHRFCSGNVGIAGYGGCLTLCATDTGLYVSASLFGIPILFWHPPLLIPWSEFHSTTRKQIIFWSNTTTYVGRPAIARMTLPWWVADYIESEQHSI